MHDVKKNHLGVVVTENDGVINKKRSRRDVVAQRVIKPYEPRNWMHIEALEDGLEVSFNGTGLNYSLDSGLTWTSLSPDETTPPINNGEKIYFKGPNAERKSGEKKAFVITKLCNIGGNIMSLEYDDFEDKFEIPYDGRFSFYFANCTTIKKVDKKFLPATKLTDTCYGGMFYGCSALEEAPELPATELKYRCYSYKELSPYAEPVYYYWGMFERCTNLKQGPSLPAKTLVTDCYAYIFGYCTNLNYIEADFIDIGPDSLKGWVHQVAEHGTFVKNKDAEWDISGASGIPTNWKVILK